MKKSLIVFAAMALAGAGASAATGTLTVTGTVVSSITMAITPGFGTVSGSGTDTSTAALGNVSKYGAVPTGFTRTHGASSYTLASTISVTVMKGNSSSTLGNILASLTNDPGLITWNLSNTPLSTTDNVITGFQFNTARDMSFSLVIPDNLSPQLANVNNTINITAVATN